jgi:D-arabinose 1-dehydrogenase-like Zn-dependent alcohol dehydrogenase
MQEFKAYAASRAKGPLERFSFDPGPLRPEEVEIKVTHCGLCHSDLSMPAFSLILGQKSVSGSPTGSPTTIDHMLTFCARHAIAPISETFPMSKVNDALERLRSGKARYRIVLINDFANPRLRPSPAQRSSRRPCSRPPEAQLNVALLSNSRGPSRRPGYINSNYNYRG